MKVLMLSGDANVLHEGTAAYERMKLQAAQVEKLTVLVREPGESKFTTAGRMRRAGRAEHFDLVTAQDPFLLGLIAWRIARTGGARLQLQLHTDLFAPAFIRHNRVKIALATFLLPKADSIRVVSQRIKDSLAPLHITAPISVLPVFIDIEALQAAPAADLHALYPQFSRILLVSSRLEAEKNVALALRTMKIICEKIPDAALLIAGSGSQRKMLEVIAHTLGVEKNVIFLGYRSDIFSLYKGADLLLNTSWYEGYGASIVEALAIGCPVVSTDVGIAREAGAIVTPPDGLGGAVIEILQSSKKGKLLLTLESQEAYFKHYKESLVLG
jgi:glycosyltransferase involved in cell wall biosynthesis